MANEMYVKNPDGTYSLASEAAGGVVSGVRSADPSAQDSKKSTSDAYYLGAGGFGVDMGNAIAGTDVTKKYKPDPVEKAKYERAIDPKGGYTLDDAAAQKLGIPHASGEVAPVSSTATAASGGPPAGASLGTDTSKMSGFGAPPTATGPGAPDTYEYHAKGGKLVDTAVSPTLHSKGTIEDPSAQMPTPVAGGYTPSDGNTMKWDGTKWVPAFQHGSAPTMFSPGSPEATMGPGGKWKATVPSSTGTPSSSATPLDPQLIPAAKGNSFIPSAATNPYTSSDITNQEFSLARSPGAGASPAYGFDPGPPPPKPGLTPPPWASPPGSPSAVQSVPAPSYTPVGAQSPAAVKPAAAMAGPVAIASPKVAGLPAPPSGDMSVATGPAMSAGSPLPKTSTPGGPMYTGAADAAVLGTKAAGLPGPKPYPIVAWDGASKPLKTYGPGDKEVAAVPGMKKEADALGKKPSLKEEVDAMQKEADSLPTPKKKIKVAK